MFEIVLVISILVLYFIYKTNTKFSNLFKRKSKRNSTHYSYRESRNASTKSRRKNKTKNHTTDDPSVELFMYEIMAKMKTDFLYNPYYDKFSSTDSSYKYKLENNEIINIRVDKQHITKLEYIFGKKGKRSTLSFSQSRILLDFYLELLKSSTSRGKNYNFDKSFNEYQNKYNNKRGKLFTDEQLKEQTKYKKLLDIFNLRKQQLDELSDNNTNRDILANELIVVEKKMKKIFPKTGL